jgi:serine protease AprX
MTHADEALPEPGRNDANGPASRDAKQAHVYRAVLEQAKILDFTSETVAAEPLPLLPPTMPPSSERRPLHPEDKIQPKLLELIKNPPSPPEPAERPAEQEMLVNFRDDLITADNARQFSFPEPVNDPRDRDAQARMREAVDKIDQTIRSMRTRAADQLTADLKKAYPGRIEVLETFWLTKTLLIKALPELAEELAKRDDVIYVELRFAGETPPGGVDAATEPQTDEGRAAINSDPYFQLGLASGYIALLDTGVNLWPPALADGAGGNIRYRLDCVNGDDHCNPVAGQAYDPGDCSSHGTDNAGILCARSNDNNFRGVTGLTVDSYKVYQRLGDGCYLDPVAVQRAFYEAALRQAKVIVAEMQGERSDFSAFASAADTVFDQHQVVVIAANGNYGPQGPACPANAHKALGVGAYGLASGRTLDMQSVGVSPDGRVKPDIQGPSYLTVLSGLNAAGPEFQLADGTSGATPFAGGAAALLRNWMLSADPTLTDPGYVYAMLILAGSNTGRFDTREGAGPFSLPATGHAWWGQTTVMPGQPVDIPLSLGPGGTALAGPLDAACWWPEQAYETQVGTTSQHNWVTLSLIYQQNQQQAYGEDPDSIFQRVRVDQPPGTTPWALRLYSAPDAPSSQTVYWAAFFHAEPDQRYEYTPSITRSATMSGEPKATDKAGAGSQNATGAPAGGAENTHTAANTPVSDQKGLKAAPAGGTPTNPPLGQRISVAGRKAEFIKMLGTGGVFPSDFIVLIGYLGDDPDPDYVRLYTNPELTGYIAIPGDQVEYATQVATEDPPLNPSYVWIKRDAQLIDHTGSVVHSYSAKFLQGRISDEQLKGDAVRFHFNTGAPGGQGQAAGGYGYAGGAYPPPWYGGAGGGQQPGYGPPPTAYCGYGYGPPPSASCGYGYTSACGWPPAYSGPQWPPPSAYCAPGASAYCYPPAAGGYGPPGAGPWGGPSMHPGCAPTSGCASPVGCHG